MLMPLAVLITILGVLTAPGLIAQHLEARNQTGAESHEDA